MAEDQCDHTLEIFLIIAIPTAIICIFEICIAVYAFSHADTVECNLLYCTAKTTTMKQTCYSNGELVNCSTIPEFNKNGIYANENDCFINHKQVNCKDFAERGFDEHFCNNGVCEVNGV